MNNPRCGFTSRIVSRAGLATAALTAALVLTLAAAAQAQTFTVLHRFKGFPTDGNAPVGVLLGRDGNLYGTTSAGGPYGVGTLFKLSPTNKETILFNFFAGGAAALKDDGQNPTGGLVEDALGNIYGTTMNGGNLTSECTGYTPGCGAIFEFQTSGKMTVLHRFTSAQGSNPQTGLSIDSERNLYGTTMSLGPSFCYAGPAPGRGSVFKLDPTNKLTVLYGFAGYINASNPGTGLLLDGSGNIYLTTYTGCMYGDQQMGGPFALKVDQEGNETILYPSSNSPDMGDFASNLVSDSAGNLFGTAVPDDSFPTGLVYELSPSGQAVVVYAFQGGTDGAYPGPTLARDSAGNLYGITLYGGGGPCSRAYSPSGCGTVFKLDPSGHETILHRFTGGSDGRYPSSLTLGADGNLYGTTTDGGLFPAYCGPSTSQTAGCGVIFKVTP